MNPACPLASGLTDPPKAMRLLRRNRRATQPFMKTGPFARTLAWIAERLNLGTMTHLAHPLCWQERNK